MDAMSKRGETVPYLSQAVVSIGHAELPNPTAVELSRL